MLFEYLVGGDVDLLDKPVQRVQGLHHLQRRRVSSSGKALRSVPAVVPASACVGAGGIVPENDISCAWAYAALRCSAGIVRCGDRLRRGDRRRRGDPAALLAALISTTPPPRQVSIREAPRSSHRMNTSFDAEQVGIPTRVTGGRDRRGAACHSGNGNNERCDARSETQQTSKLKKLYSGAKDRSMLRELVSVAFSYS